MSHVIWKGFVTALALTWKGVVTHYLERLYRTLSGKVLSHLSCAGEEKEKNSLSSALPLSEKGFLPPLSGKVPLRVIWKGFAARYLEKFCHSFSGKVLSTTFALIRKIVATH